MCSFGDYILILYFMAYTLRSLAKKDAILKAMVTDVAGRFHELIFPIKFLPELCDTWLAFDGSSFEGINTVSNADAVMLGQFETIIQCPKNIQTTDKEEYWIICNIHDTDGNPHPNCVRNLIIQMQDTLWEVWDWWKLYLWAEPEAYFVSDTSKLLGTDGGNTSYFDTKSDIIHIVGEITNTLSEIWFEIERAHTEVGQKQFEINWKYDAAEKTADKIQLYKLICLKVARIYDIEVTFLPKPYPNRNGSGMHYHLSVSNEKENLFFDESNKKWRFFSKPALSFLQSILNNSRAIASIANKAEASYARLVPGFEAPVVLAIAPKNRSAACRVPAVEDPKKLKKWIRAEFRFPDPLANPYLLASAFLGCGLEGIQKNTKFQGFTTENLYALNLDQIYEAWYSILPRSLGESYNELWNSPVLKKYLWTSIYEELRKLMREEIWESQPYANYHSTMKHYLW